MSRSNPTADMRNPAVRFMEWSGSKGAIQYYDKEKGENIEVPTPFSFLLLDQLSTLTGFIESMNTGVWSNEVRDTRKDKLVVKTKFGILRVALYDDLKDIVAKGAKFAKSIYVAFYDDDKVLKIGHFKFSGSAFSAWMDFLKAVDEKDLYTKAFTIDGKVKKKKGSNTYFEPTFKLRPVSEETNTFAYELDKKLQTYLSAYLDQPVEVSEVDVVLEDLEDFNPEEYERQNEPSPEELKEMMKELSTLDEDDVEEEGVDEPM